MTLWLIGFVRQWQRHRFGTLLLVTAYALGIALSTLVYAGISAAAEREQGLGMGNPLRMMSVSVVERRGDEPLPVDLDRWLAGVKVAWVRVFLDGKGGELDPALQGRTIVAMAGSGPTSWHPPVRSGRFLSDAEVAAGAKVAVIGEKLPPALPGYTVVGRTADQVYNRGWDRDVFVPLTSLPPAVRQVAGAIMLHWEIAPGEDLARAKVQIEANLRRAFPDIASINVMTADDSLQSTAHRFQRAFGLGFGLSGLLIAFIAANAGVLSIHWLLQRRRELGVRIALGGTVAGVAAMVGCEQICLGLAGAVVAVPLIALALYGAAHSGLPVSLSWSTLAVAGGASLGSGLLSCLVPLIVLARTPLARSLHLQD